MFVTAARATSKQAAPPCPEGGMTLVELAVSMAGLAVVAVMLVSFFVGVTRVDTLHEADDQALVSLREMRQRITRDIREARGLTGASGSSISVWIDADWDGVQEPGELVTWTITEGGDLTRAVDDGAPVTVAGGLDAQGSRFGFDTASLSDIRRVTVNLRSNVDDQAGGERWTKFEISLRNLP